MSLQSNDSIKNTLKVIDDFCQELVREGFLKKANLDVEPVSIESNSKQPANVLKSFLSQIQNISEQAGNKDKELVQINADKKEINRRIAAFMAYKRMAVNELNIQEFCNRISASEEVENSCARVDAILVKRPGSNSHVKKSCVVNQWGPQTNPHAIESSQLIKMEEPVENGGNSTDAIEERINNMETHLKINLDKSDRKDTYARLKCLEDRILYLEGISPDYIQTTTQKMVKRKRVAVNNYKCGQQMSFEELNSRIATLRQSLKCKQESLQINNVN